MNPQIRTPIEIKSGWLNGHVIRRARKPARCVCLTRGRFCGKRIEPGGLYVEGEGNGETGRNGVLLQDKYCIECAGEEALAALAKPLSTGDQP